jgi:hypothetical protein
VGLAAALAMIAIGCGRGDGSEDVTVVDDLDPLQAVEDAGSARISFEVDLELPGEDVRIRSTGEGIAAYPDGDLELAGESTIEGEGVAEPGPGVAQHAEVRRVDGTTYLRLWNEDEDPPSWIEMPDAPGGGDGLGGGQMVTDPMAVLDTLRDEARSFTEVGSEDVRGDAATRYRAEVDPEAFDDITGLWGEDAPDEVTVDVWVDDAERLRRMEAGGLVLELWDFGVEVDVEVPEDVEAAPDLGGAMDELRDTFPQVEGEWSEQATGTTSGAAWTVFTAAGSMGDQPTTCRTLELASGGPTEEVPPAVEDPPLAMHGTRPATCGSGSVSVALGSFEPDPDVQLLVPMGTADDPALVAFVVDPERAGGGIRIVRDGAEPVDLPVDPSGVTVWDGTGSTGIVAVQLDDGAQTCAITEQPGQEVVDGDGFDPDGMMALIGASFDACEPT